MKFSELPMGARFRLHRRGIEHTKTAKDQFPADTEVVYDEPHVPEPPPATTPDPFGSNDVVFVKGGVRLDGVFTAEQLEAVLAALKKRKR